MKCYDCTQHKAVLFGMPGIRATIDEAARQVAQVKYDAHLKVRIRVLVSISVTV